MRKIYLHGFIGKKYGRKFKFAVTTAGEAVRALAANFPGILEDFKKGHWRIVRGDQSRGLHLELDDVNAFNLGAGDLHFVPSAKGSKRGPGGGAIKTVIGVALVGAAVVATGGALGMVLPGILGVTGLTGGNLAMMGVALAVSGVASLLSPKEQPTDNQSIKADVALGPVNTYEQGNPVPLVYGECIVGSVVVSSGLTLTPYSMINAVIGPTTNASTLLGSGITTGAV